MEIIEKSITNGDILIFYDDACTYDSRLDVLYRKCLITDPETGSQHMDLNGSKMPYDPNFRLFILSRETLELDLQTRCNVINYMFTECSLNEFFLDTVFEKEKPAKRQEYLLICGREIEALSASRR